MALKGLWIQSGDKRFEGKCGSEEIHAENVLEMILFIFKLEMICGRGGVGMSKVI